LISINDSHDHNTDQIALLPGIEKELVKATRQYELRFIKNPKKFITDFDDFLNQCQQIDRPPARIRSLSRILSIYVNQFPHSISLYHQQTIVMLVSKWVKNHPQTAIICYCSRIMKTYQSEFKESFLDFRDFILYQQSNHSKGVQSIIRNYL